VLRDRAVVLKNTMRMNRILATTFSLLMSFAVRANSLTVDLHCRKNAQCAVRGTVVARAGSIETKWPIESRSVVIDGLPGSEWELSLEGAGFWAPPLRVTIPAAAAGRQAWDVWRTGRLRMSLKSPDGVPDGARIVVASPPDPRRPPEIAPGTWFDCTAGDDARWNCDVPATLLDLSIRGKGGYTPQYKWDVDPKPEGVLDLGTIDVRKGASILAWLDPDFMKRVEQPVRASVRHQTAAAVDTTAVRLAAPIAEALFTKKGFVQLSALAPGRYVLDVQSQGYIPVRIPVEIVEGRESVLRKTIELFPSASVRLRLIPPLGPSDAPWHLDLVRQTDFGTGSEPAGSGVASREGVFVAHDQAEGPLRVFVRDAEQNVYGTREVVVVANGSEQILTLDIVALTGAVTIGDAPLPNASLLFGGSGGREKIRAVADEEGRFHTVLPRRGKWQVDVESTAEVVATIVEVSVSDDAKEIAIELPSTEVSGWVQASSGERAKSAAVRLMSDGKSMWRRIESDGTFRFRGVNTGNVELQATDESTGERSRLVSAVIAEEGRMEGIELRLDSLRSVRGQVRSGGYPVIGAQVIGYALVGGSGNQERAVTDTNGGFAFDVPDSAPDLNLMVAALGSIFHPFRVPAAGPIVLDLAPAGGDVQLRWPTASTQRRVMFNDVPVQLHDLLEWGRANGKRADEATLLAPDMAPGRYQFCADARCVEGVLAVGGHLELNAAN
jgi:hypothetical protein